MFRPGWTMSKSERELMCKMEIRIQKLPVTRDFGFEITHHEEKQIRSQT